MQGKERTVLVLVHDREGNLTGAVAVGTDTAAMQVSVTAYPQQTEVVYRTALYTLAECYRDGGISAAECLSAATGESYDAVLRLSTQALGSLASQVGGIPYVLSKPWGSLEAGEQTLASLQLAELLEYTDWPQPVTEQARVHAAVVKALLQRYLTPRRDLRTAFNALVTACDDRLTIAQFSAVEEELAALIEALPSYTVTVPHGESVGVAEKKRYVLTD